MAQPSRLALSTVQNALLGCLTAFLIAGSGYGGQDTTPTEPGKDPKTAGTADPKQGKERKGGGSTKPGLVNPKPRIEVRFEDGGIDQENNAPMATYMRFGVIALDMNNPRGAYKKLTFNPYGRTNTTVVRIDGKDRVFGKDGKWAKMAAAAGGKKTPALTSKTKWGSSKTECLWDFDEGIRVTQTVEIVPGEPREIGGRRQRLLDTALMRYRIENRGAKPHRVGLRFLLDTLIGENDGVPFTVPGLPGLVDRFHDFAPPNPIPAFIQVMERPDLKNPGLIALLNFKVGAKVEPPTRVSLTRWTGVSPVWEIPVQPMQEDSAVVIYWNERELKPGVKREIGFTYGLGRVTSGEGGIGLSVGGEFKPGGEFTVVALVSVPQKGETVELKLPAGFTLVAGERPRQAVPAAQIPGRPSPVTWRVRAGSAGTFTLEVQSSAGRSGNFRVSIRPLP